MRRILRIFLIAVVTLTAACGALPASRTPATAPTPVTDVAADLAALAAQSLPAAATVQAGGLRMGTAAIAVQAADGGALWLAHSTGARSITPRFDHFVAIYSHGPSGWRQLASIQLPCPDYLGEGSVTQVSVEPTKTWLQVNGGAGAHGGCFDLLSFDGAALRSEAHSQNSSPAAGWVQDANGDGVGDVVLDLTDPYVFCYACGMRFPRYRVLAWDGAKLAEVKLAPLPDSAPADLRRLANRAVSLAQARLWKDAWETMAQAQMLKPLDATAAWDAALINLHADAFAKNAQGSYPLLGSIFYGDDDAALALMRAYPPQALFAKPSPLVVGTAAESWEAALANWITTTTTLQMTAQPDLAAAYFLRGWGLNLVQPNSRAVLTDIERAAQLAPNDTLLKESVRYLRTR